MRLGHTTVGTVLTLVGVVWISQGAGLLRGSFMTGSSKWLLIGVVCVVIGLAFVMRGLRPRE